MYDDDQFTDAVSTLEYLATAREIEEAGFGSGFSIRHIASMPEHDFEFVPDDEQAGCDLEDDLAADAWLAPCECWA